MLFYKVIVTLYLSRTSCRCIVDRRFRVRESNERWPLYSLSAFVNTPVDSSAVSRICTLSSSLDLHTFHIQDMKNGIQKSWKQSPSQKNLDNSSRCCHLMRGVSLEHIIASSKKNQTDSCTTYHIGYIGPSSHVMNNINVFSGHVLVIFFRTTIN